MLVEQHATEVYRLTAAIVGTGDAADVAQESFVAAWQQLPKLRDGGVFSPWLRRILAFVVPLAFVNYFPALYILGRHDTLGAPGFVRFMGPAVAVATVLVARMAWRRGVRHYQSTGS